MVRPMMSIHYQGSPNNAMHLSRHLKVAGNIFLSLRQGDGKRYSYPSAGVAGRS
jgi:hypothetical protein